MSEQSGDEDWRPSASLQVLQLRAQVLHHIREFFANRRVLEVDTPLLGSTTNPDPNIDSFSTMYTGPHAPKGVALYLQSSPEFAMKRLLCAGSGPIYQICKAFRQGECGSLHNPEFTILEWYQPGFDLAALIAELEALLQGLFKTAGRELARTQTITYQQAFHASVDIDPLHASLAELANCLKHHGVEVRGLHNADRDAWLDVLMSHCIQPHLGKNRMTVVTDYPASQAALAKSNPDNALTALRFELFIDGVELANGFQELTDVEEQQRRFQQDLVRRKHQHQHQPPMDAHLLQALTQGMPDCSGVAVGLDRVIMLLAGANRLSEVMAFPVGRV